MAIDIRATVTCNLGTLISGSVSDDYIQGTGLIKTKGNCVIDGLISPAVGTAVTFTYVKSGVTRTIPRGLVVISSFADPFRRTTTVQVGCKLTLQQNKREPILWSIFSDPLNSDVTEEELAIVTRPIFASSVAAQCASRLGIGGVPGLTNKFSISAFDFSAGYVSILSDLMVSECKCGYMQGTISLASFSLSESGGSGPVLDQSKIIDIAPIGVGELPGETVYVNYSTLKLKDPEPVTQEPIPDGTAEGQQQQEVGGWGAGSGDTVTGSSTDVTVTFNKANGTSVTKSFSYIPRSTTHQTYDAFDRVVTRTTTERVCAAAVNASYIVAALEYADRTGSSAPASGSATYETTTVTRYSYYKSPSFATTSAPPALFVYTVSNVGDLPTPGMSDRVYKVTSECGKEYVWDGSSWVERDNTQRLEQNYGKKVLPDGYDQVSSEITERYEPVIAIVGAVAPGYVDENDDFITIPGGVVLSERTETTYKHGNRAVVKQNAFDPSKTDTLDIPITGSTTVTYRAYAYTPGGQQDIAARVANGQNLNDFLSSCTSLAYVGVQRSHSSGREAALQARPSQADQVYNATAKKDDSGTSPSNESGGYSTASESKIELITGGSGDSVVLLSMPYAPDDTFLRTGTCPNVTYLAIPSDAASKARAFGRAQNQLLHGNRYGLNVQTAPEYLPTAPFAPFYISVGGVTASYRTNGTSWTFDSNGIVVSTDALFMGGAGAIGGSTDTWFPVAPGITTLPTTPATTNTAPSQIIGDVATVGTNAQTTLNAAFPSAVNGDGVVDLATSDIWVKESGAWVNRGPTPGVTLNVETLVPVANERVTVNGRTRASVQVTSIPYALTRPLVTLTPAVKAKVLGYRVLLVNVPTAIDISMAGLAPLVSIGAVVPAGVSGIVLTALAPDVINDVSLNVPTLVIAVAGVAPLVQTGASMAVPAADVAIAALVPLSAGSSGALLFAPVADVAVAALVPLIATGTSIAVPAIDIACASLAPAQAGPDGDPEFSNVSLLLHMNGSNGSTTFTDSSAAARAITVNGNAQISTAQSKFGGASALFDGTTDWLTAASDAAFTFSGDFTIEFWLYINTMKQSGVISNGAGSFGGTAFVIVLNHPQQSNKLSIWNYPSSSSSALCATGTLSTATWYHAAFVRSGTTLTAFLDGVAGTSATTSATFTTSATNLRIGRYWSGDFAGYIDEVRITKDVARYTSAFTPPSQPFPDA